MMSAVLRILLEVTVYSAVLYAAIVLFKKAFRRHMSAALNYAVWAILILRLLVPLTIDSGFSVIPETSTPIAQNQTLEDTQPTDSRAHTPQIASSSQISPIYHETADNLQKINLSSHTTAHTREWKLGWQAAIVLVWGLGVCVFSAYMLRIWLRLRRRISRSGINLPGRVIELTQSAKRQMGIKADIKVSAHEWLTTPALSASVVPKLLLPSHLLKNSEQLIFGIRHELTHYKHKDYLVSLLLIVLRCVYWFNPVVWLAAKRIETDMETACDVSVTAAMKNSQRGRYIEAMIDLSQDADAQYMLGMGTRADRQSIEKRIRGMFMIKRTAPAVRTAAALLACLMLVACFTTACQPTPETPPVVNKGDDRLEEMIASSAALPVPTVTIDPEQSKQEQEEALRQALRDRINAPETYADSFTNAKGDITVTFDNAVIEVPAVQNIPVVTVKPYRFSQETVDTFAEYFLQGAPVFTQEYVRTKEEIEAEIIQWRSDIQRTKNEDELTDSMKEYLTGAEQRLKELEKHYEDAPVERAKTPATLAFEQTESGQKVTVVADLGKDDAAEFNVYDSEKGGSIFFSNCGKGFYSYWFEPVTDKIPKGMTMTLREATALVNQSLKDLGLKDMEIDGAYYSYYNDSGLGNTDKQCYYFEVRRMFHGIPVTRIHAATPHDTDDPTVPASKKPEYTDVIQPEWLFFDVDDTGVICLQWVAPFEEDEVLSENVTLMPFDEIVQKAKDNMFYQNYTSYGSESHIHITSIKLGMMRVMKKDKPGEYMMIPVWDFIGNREDIVDGKTKDWLPFGNQSYVTINAIDGSHINRDWGY